MDAVGERALGDLPVPLHCAPPKPCGPKGRARAGAVLCVRCALRTVRARAELCAPTIGRLLVRLFVRTASSRAGPGFSRLQLWRCHHWAPSPRAFALVCLFAQAHLHVVALRSLLAQDGSSIMGDGAGAAVLETWAAGLQRFEQMTGSLLLSSRQMIAAVCVPFVTLVAAAARTRICSGCCAIGVAASARVCCSHHRPPASGRRPALGECGGAPVGVLVLSRRRWRRHAALRRLCGIVGLSERVGAYGRYGRAMTSKAERKASLHACHDALRDIVEKIKAR